MTATVFSSPEPDVAIQSSDAPMVIGNPDLIRRAEVRRRPAWMIATPVAVLALAVAGIVVAVGHRHAPPATLQVAQTAPPPVLSPATDRPVVSAQSAPAAASAAIPPHAARQRLAPTAPAHAPTHHAILRSRAVAPNAMTSAADASATAPVASPPPAATPSATPNPIVAPVTPSIAPIPEAPTTPSTLAPMQITPAAPAPPAATPSPGAPQR